MGMRMRFVTVCFVYFFGSPWLKWYFPDFIFFQVGDDDGDSGLQFFEDVINLPCYL